MSVSKDQSIMTEEKLFNLVIEKLSNKWFRSPTLVGRACELSKIEAELHMAFVGGPNEKDVHDVATKLRGQIDNAKRQVIVQLQDSDGIALVTENSNINGQAIQELLDDETIENYGVTELGDIYKLSNFWAV